MSTDKKIILTVFLMIPTFLIIIAVLFYYYLLPKNPLFNYFPEKSGRYPELRWEFNHFQPIYLYSYKDKEGVFIKSLYRNKDKKLRLVDLYLGGNKAGIDLPLASYTPDDSEKETVTSVEDIREKFNIGDRFKVAYVSNVFPDLEGDIIGFNDPRINEICSDEIRACILAELMTKGYMKYLVDLGVLDRIPKGGYIPVLMMSGYME